MSTNVIYPQRALINAITNATQAVITFTEAHDFTEGESVSFRVTRNFGMFQINNLRGTVIDSATTTITVDIDTSDWDAFDYSVLDDPGTTPPVCLPSSSTRVPGSNPPRVNLQDTFDNRRS